VCVCVCVCWWCVVSLFSLVLMFACCLLVVCMIVECACVSFGTWLISVCVCSFLFAVVLLVYF